MAVLASVRRNKGTDTIHGIVVPRRRFTRWAAIYFLGYFCLPLLALCFLVDLALYFLFTEVFGTCYAVLCWFA